MAGPALRAIMALGKFHGVIAATTPSGVRCSMIVLPPPRTVRQRL